MPARKYVFRAEELAGHYSESKLGHSYSFWVPWDRVGGPQRQVSLIARFKSAQGGVVMSEMTRHLLPGAQPSALPLVQTQPAPAQRVPAGRCASIASAAHVSVGRTINRIRNGPGGMQTTTITLSDALGAAAPQRKDGERTCRGSRPDAARKRPRPPCPRAAADGATAASSMEPGEIQALVREAVQDALAANQEEQPVDRFGRRKYRARIAPKLPPTRDPAPTPLHPAAPQSALASDNSSGSTHWIGDRDKCRSTADATAVVVGPLSSWAQHQLRRIRLIRRVAFVRLAIDFRNPRFAHAGRGRRQAALASLGHAHEVAGVAHVGANVVRRSPIAAQKPLGAGQRSAVVDHRLGRIVHRAGRLLPRQKAAQLALSKHLRIAALRRGAKQRCAQASRQEKRKPET